MEPETSSDPCEIFTEDILIHIFSHLSPRQLFKCALVSSSWQRIATLDQIWIKICRQRWKGKVYVPAAQRNDLSWKQKYLKAESDRRAGSNTISFEQLTTFTWRFRFKRTAGTWFVAIDPYWVHGKDESKMMIRKFTPDGKFESPVDDPFHEQDEDFPMRWTFTSTGGVRVNDYPELVLRRTPDWGFTLENMWVLLKADLTPIDENR